ncbi:MAG: hypothetical protein R3E98_10650 [Gemmatimonadota bacterium]
MSIHGRPRAARCRWILLPLLAAALLASGCADATAPGLDGEGLAAFPLPIPTLPTVAAELGEAPDLARARALWADSWGAGAADPEGLRAEARRIVADRAAAGRDALQLTADRAQLRSATAELRGLLGDASALEDHLSAVDARVGASEQVEGVQALERVLEASDRLLSVPLPALTEGLLTCPAAAPRRNAGPGAYPEIWQTRALHLQTGARQALAEGDLQVAVRRAWYGCRLLSRPPGPGSGPR